jgi:hypothetical protein
VTTELAGAVLTVAIQYQTHDRPLPDHVRAELEQIAATDTLSASMRSEAARLLLDGAR